MFLEERVNLSFTTCINIPLVTARYSAGSLFQRFEYPEVRYSERYVIPEVSSSEGSIVQK